MPWHQGSPDGPSLQAQLLLREQQLPGEHRAVPLSPGLENKAPSVSQLWKSQREGLWLHNCPGAIKYPNLLSLVWNSLPFTHHDHYEVHRTDRLETKEFLKFHSMEPIVTYSVTNIHQLLKDFSRDFQPNLAPPYVSATCCSTEFPPVFHYS